MNLYCIGINHRTAPVEIREQFWFTADETHTFLSFLKRLCVEECVLISTCNRTELYYIPQQVVPDGVSLLKELVSQKGMGETIHERQFYSLSALHAVRHLYKLTSGIDSMVVGDVQILSQVKDAFTAARDANSVGPVLHRLFTNALHVGKRARAETDIGEGAVSAGYASAELVSKIFGNLSERTALLIGAGETGALTAKHLHSNRLGRLLIANRTRERAEMLSRQLGAATIDYDTFRTSLPEVDIIVTSVASDDYILSATDLKQAMRARGGRPLVVVDLGVPRNVDPAAGTIGNLFLHDIDGLQHIITQNLGRRQSEIPSVQRIILPELVQFDLWYRSRELAPTIQELQQRFEEIRSSEVERMYARFSPDVHEEITMLTRRIVNKILHAPMVNLRKRTQQGRADTIWHELQLLRSVFGLGHRLRDTTETAAVDAP